MRETNLFLFPQGAKTPLTQYPPVLKTLAQFFSTLGGYFKLHF